MQVQDRGHPDGLTGCDPQRRHSHGDHRGHCDSGRRGCTSRGVPRRLRGCRLGQRRQAEARAHGSHNRAIRPASSPPTDRVLEIASSTSASSVRARASRDSPASVRSTRCVERRNRSHPHETLQTADLAAERGLGDEQPPCCPAETEILGHCDEEHPDAAIRERPAACGKASTLRSPSITPVCLSVTTPGKVLCTRRHRRHAQPASPLPPTIARLAMYPRHIAA